MIVSLHTAFASYFPESPAWSVAVNTACRNFFDAAISTCFALSGMLMFWKKRSYASVLKNKAVTLAIPYVLWSLVYWVKEMVIFRLSNGFFPDIPLLPYIALQSANGIFWFLRTLMGITLLYPALRWCLLKKLPACILGVLCTVLSAMGLVEYASIPYWIPHYLMGAWIGMYHRRQVEAVVPRRWFLPAGLILAALAVFRPQEGSLHYLYWLPAPALLWMLTDILPGQKPLPWWMNTSFFLYCSHLLTERYAVKLYLFLMGQGTLAFLLSNILLPCICAAMALAGGAIVRKLLPQVFGWFTGWRKSQSLPMKSAS